jgi:FkbM family methyltransferase
MHIDATTRMNIKSRLWFALHNNRRNPIVARFARLCKNIHRATEHPTYDINVNGEKFVLARALAANKFPVIFDVGANVGNWAITLKSLIPNATIHSFELDPRTAEVLASHCAGMDSVIVHAYGLGSVTGAVDFFSYSGAASELSSLRAALHNHVSHTIQSAFIRSGDDVCAKHNIESIDFLKIDAEGSDFDVLQGFSAMISKQLVKVIQFEHQGGRYLKDFYDFFEPMGYTIGKLYSNYVAFRPHSAELEDFLGPNYIAVPKTNRHFVDSLTKGWKWKASS